MLSVATVAKGDEYIKHRDHAVKLDKQKLCGMRYLRVVFCKYNEARFRSTFR